MDKLIQHNIVVKKSPIHGYGVFTTDAIKKGDVIETCHSIISSFYDTDLEDYYFYYDNDINKSWIPTGFGLIYNHATNHNADYYFDETKCLMTIKALRNIAKDEEIFISYGEQWFANRNLYVKKTSRFVKLWRYLKQAPLRALIVLSGLLILMHLDYVLAVAKPAQKILQILATTIPQAINA